MGSWGRRRGGEGGGEGGEGGGGGGDRGGEEEREEEIGEAEEGREERIHAIEWQLSCMWGARDTRLHFLTSIHKSIMLALFTPVDGG